MSVPSSWIPAIAAWRRSPSVVPRATSARIASLQAPDVRKAAACDALSVSASVVPSAEAMAKRTAGSASFVHAAASATVLLQRFAAARRTSGAGSPASSEASTSESAGSSATPVTRRAGSVSRWASGRKRRLETMWSRATWEDSASAAYGERAKKTTRSSLAGRQGRPSIPLRTIYCPAADTSGSRSYFSGLTVSLLLTDLTPSVSRATATARLASS
jgi:hypothetical protein